MAKATESRSINKLPNDQTTVYTQWYRK